MLRIDGKEEEGAIEEADRTNRKLLQDQFCRLIFQEEIKWKQRSRIKWLKAGDRNTKFFHAIATAYRHANRINVIEARARIWDKRQDIEREVVEFSQHLYLGDGHRSRPRMDGVSLRQLSISSASSLEFHFKNEEIKGAVFSLGGDHAPGPDGFPIVFYQHFWDILEDDLLVFFKEFHNNGAITGELGASFTSLIPKKGVVSIKGYRPSSPIGSF